MIPRLIFDLETCSLLDLRKVGVSVYAAHPTTQVTTLCYGFSGNGPIHTWTAGPPPSDFVAMVRAGAPVVAHNAAFEETIYAAILEPLGWPPIAPAQWSCTMIRGLVAGLPASLEEACPAAGLSIRKDTSQRDLMLRFARPRKLEPLTWWHETDLERFAHLQAYCRADVAAERALDAVLPELTEAERQVWNVDRAINARGLRIDVELVARMQRVATAEQQRINAALAALTAGAVTKGSQVARLVAWLATRNVATESLDRESVERLLLEHKTGPVHDVLQARLDVSRSSTAKLTALQVSLCADRRLRGSLQFYGASRTGRWSGRRFQPQNLPRPTIKDVPLALALIRADTPVEDLDLLFEDSPMGVLASCLRGCIEAAPGKTLVAGDLAQIEARIIAWLAGQVDVLELFRRGDDVYSYTARQLGSSSRQLGKVLVLACAYGMGPARFLETAASYRLTLSPAEAETAVAGWRELNEHIVRYWWDSFATALDVVASRPGTQRQHRSIGYRRTRRCLEVVLPSSRVLIYRDVKLTEGRFGQPSFSYASLWPGKWHHPQETYGGKLVENITQAIARDVLAAAMVRLHRKGMPLVCSIHDEVIGEVPLEHGPAAREWMLQVMRRPLSWAPGLPVEATGWCGPRYQKA